MKRLATLLLSLSIILGTGCTSDAAQDNSAKELQEQNTMSVLWYQQSGERDSLYLQGYHLARRILDEKLKEQTAKKKAIVLDIDETVLDNSPYLAFMIKEGQEFDKGWDKWVDTKRSKPLPGALDFLIYADKVGISIYYVTNRTESQLQPTLENLQACRFPQADKEHVLMKGEKSSKESRREQIEQTHDILLLFGDNLSDFAVDFDEGNYIERKQTVDHFKEEFGKRFIVFPNPMYGDWERALYKTKYLKTNAKLKQRKNALEPYQ